MKSTEKSNKFLLYDAVLCSLFAAMICIMSPLAIPIGPIPITLGFFAMFLTGIILPPKDSAIAVSIYIALGAVGLPVFSSARGGFSVILGPTGGYIWGYIPMVVVTGLFIKLFCRGVSNHALNTVLYVAASLCGGLVCYAAGTIQFMILTHSSLSYSLSMCVLPFIPLDIAKAVLASTVGVVVRPVILSMAKPQKLKS